MNILHIADFISQLTSGKSSYEISVSDVWIDKQSSIAVCDCLPPIGL